MTAIIFGYCGFIGVNLTKYLLNRGYTVIGVDTCCWNNGNIENLHPFILDIREDITYEVLTAFILDKFNGQLDEIYNLACPASPIDYQNRPLFTLETCIAVSKICEFAKWFKAKILHASTSEVYGDALVCPQKETHNGNVNILGLRSCYDEGKRVAETILYEYSKLGVECKIVRIFNTYGPNMKVDDGRVIPNFINQALNNEDITIYGNGKQVRSFMYIDDLLDGIFSYMNTFGSNVINLGYPEGCTIDELADLILELIPESKSKKIYLELPKDDPVLRIPDISKAKTLINFSPKVTLREGLIKTINYYVNS